MTQRDNTNTTPIVSVYNLSKDYYLGRTVVHALDEVNLEIARGEFVAIMGPSGSGKSTFMNLLGCLDRPTSGEYILDGIPVSEMSMNELADVRNQKIGFVFQSFNLLPALTTQDNVELPLMYTDIPRELRHQRVAEALEQVGLLERAQHRPMELSGGQQQRVAIARALVTRPSLILADEPTGNLDSHTSIEIMAILQQLNAEGITVILVTHESDIANYCRRRILFRDGHKLEDIRNSTPLLAREVFAAPFTPLASSMPEQTEVRQ